MATQKGKISKQTQLKKGKMEKENKLKMAKLKKNTNKTQKRKKEKCNTTQKQTQLKKGKKEKWKQESSHGQEDAQGPREIRQQLKRPFLGPHQMALLRATSNGPS